MLTLPPRDKVLHGLAGAALYTVGHLAGGPLLGSGLCLGGGAGKELWDRASRRGTAEAADFFATCLGGALAALAQLFMR